MEMGTCGGYEVLTPDLAFELLSKLDTHQRPFDQLSFNRLAYMVQHYGWQPWLTRVVVCDRGTVIDGQHTLTYIWHQPVGTVWTTMVVRGVPHRLVNVVAHYASWEDSALKRAHHRRIGLDK